MWSGSEVKWVKVKFLGIKVPCILRWTYTRGTLLFYQALQASAGYGLLDHEVSWSHTTTRQSRYDSSGRVISSSSQRPLPYNTQHIQQTSIHTPGGIRTHNRAATGTGRVFGETVTFSFGYILNYGCCNLNCGGCNLLSNVWVCVCVGFCNLCLFW
jgi:hypothetical protein